MPTAIQISRDDAVLVGNAGRWRDAMERMGKAGVEVEMRRRPGPPTDVVLDIGDEAPYPTRAFCEQWCTEQDNILFRFSPRMGIILTLCVLLLVCVLNAITDIGRVPIGPRSGRGAMPMAAGGGGNGAASAGIPGVRAFQPFTPPRSMPLPTMQQSGRTAGSTSGSTSP